MALAASLSACSSDDTTQPAGKNKDKVVRVEAAVAGIPTRGYYSPGQTPKEFSFTINNSEDLSYIYNNVLITKGEGNTWTSAQTMLWQNYTTPVDLYAYAPRNAEYNGDIYDAGDFPVSVDADQTANDNNTYTQDFLVFKRKDFVPQKDLTSRGTVNVEFSHALCCFHLEVELGTEFDYPTPTDENSISDLTIGGTITGGHCDFRTDPLPTVSVVEGTTPTPVKPYKGDFTPATGGPAGETKNAIAVFDCILMPQTVAAKGFYISFNLNGRNFVWKAPEEVKLEGGKRYQLSLRAGYDRVVAGEITATPWEDTNLPDMETE